MDTYDMMYLLCYPFLVLVLGILDENFILILF